MKSLYGKIVVVILVAGLLPACGAQATQAPTSAPPPTENIVPTTAVPTEAAQATEPATATQPPGQNSQGATVSFAKDVLPIIESRCVNCHGGQRVEKGLDMKTYADLMSGSENGPVVTPGNALDSTLVELIVNQKMPKRGPKLTPPQVEIITSWVNQGAQDN